MSLMSVQRLEARRRRERVSGSLTENKYIPTSRHGDWNLVTCLQVSCCLKPAQPSSLSAHRCGVVPRNLLDLDFFRTETAAIPGKSLGTGKVSCRPTSHCRTRGIMVCTAPQRIPAGCTSPGQTWP